MRGKTIKLKEKIYHGSITLFDEIDLYAGRKYKDFGRGFYLAYKKDQAIKMMNKKARELGLVNTYFIIAVSILHKCLSVFNYYSVLGQKNLGVRI